MFSVVSYHFISFSWRYGAALLPGCVTVACGLHSSFCVHTNVTRSSPTSERCTAASKTYAPWKTTASMWSGLHLPKYCAGSRKLSETSTTGQSHSKYHNLIISPPMFLVVSHTHRCPDAHASGAEWESVLRCNVGVDHDSISLIKSYTRTVTISSTFISDACLLHRGVLW